MGWLDAAKYDDPDEHRARLIGWDREITMLEPGPLGLRWTQAILGDVVVAEGWVGRAISDWSTVAEGRLNFVVCISTQRPGRWCGLEATPGHAIVAGAGRDFRSITAADFRSLEFIVPEDLFPELRDIRGGPSARDFSPRRCLIRLEPALEAKVARLRATLFDDPIGTASATTDAVWVAVVRQQTLGLLRALAGRFAAPVRPQLMVRTIPGHDRSIAAMHYIDANAPFLDRVAEIADALGISARALQQAFRSYVGISPHQYLLARKLHLARQQLNRPPLIRSPVTDAAITAGLTHFGRFSASYRALFGETPRATLARAVAQLAAAAE
jgi:AraC-like DNA-binding protein